MCNACMRSTARQPGQDIRSPALFHSRIQRPVYGRRLPLDWQRHLIQEGPPASLLQRCLAREMSSSSSLRTYWTLQRNQKCWRNCWVFCSWMVTIREQNLNSGFLIKQRVGIWLILALWKLARESTIKSIWKTRLLELPKGFTRLAGIFPCCQRQENWSTRGGEKNAAFWESNMELNMGIVKVESVCLCN